MATATATESTRSGGLHPRADVVFTGGSESDRLTLSDIAAAHASLEYDTESGVLTQSDTTPRAYRLGGSSTTASKDAFVDIPYGIIELYTGETGVDTSSADKGNSTSKLILDHQCDAIIGREVTGDPALDGRLVLRGENYSYNYYTYAEIFSAQAKVVCHGFVVLSGRNNSRFVIQNSNEDSVIKVIFTVLKHLDPYTDNGDGSPGSSPSLNIDPPSGESDIRLLGSGPTFRSTLTPSSTLTGDEISIPEVVVEGASASVYFNRLHDINNFLTINGLRLTRLDNDDPPILRTSLHQWNCKRTNQVWALSQLPRRWKVQRCC